MSLLWVSWNPGYGSGSGGYRAPGEDPSAAIGEMAEKYRSLPRAIARKHLKAAMRRTIRAGVPILRKYTPPVNADGVAVVRRGRRSKGDKKRSSGELRKSVMVKTGQKGRNGDANSFVYGVLGYRYSGQSRKAIWLERGTRGGVRPYRMIEKATAEFGRPCADKLAQEMAAALEKAIKEAASKRHPGMSRRGLAAGVRPRF